MTEAVYKLVDGVEWEVARIAGAYAGSAVDRADGYIHMSTAAQLPETARRHYAGRTGLVLAAVDATALGAGLKWEPSRGGDLFPHLYGTLPLSAVRSERSLSIDEDGRLLFDDGGPTWA